MGAGRSPRGISRSTKKGRPNLGPFPCGGLVTINSESKEITRSGQYWAFCAFFTLHAPGRQRFSRKLRAGRESCCHGGIRMDAACWS